MLPTPPGVAATLGVSPLIVELDGAQRRSGSVNVSNDEGLVNRVQVKLTRWTQDADGQDVLEDSEQLLYHPRLMNVDPGTQRLVRLGLRRPPGEVEEAYRLFVEELPSPLSANAGGGSQVAVSVRFAVPVFVRPAEVRPGLRLSLLPAGRPDEAQIQLQNTGNVHVRATTLTLRGTVGQEVRTEGWYVLAGATRRFTVKRPGWACGLRGNLQVLIDTPQGPQQQPIEVSPELCQK
ncbi:fimbrial biogenesis chaperone [Ideonella livida]|uniref:Molecular chaperone n=1 Tax=Ideonella livida TaxID=2707176 RepID=A0A7C9TM80_9BURK|nr:fimbria/pilus periplasmic chaperone [Ideonella livida]NDY92127.1 molecular chaperone [Ideonella livida]